MPPDTETRTSLQATYEGDENRNGSTVAHGFEVITISAGVGNGWTFPPAVLEESLPLWNNIEVFLHHEQLTMPTAGGRDVIKLAGYLSEPVYHAPDASIRAQLTTAGPSGPALADLGAQKLNGAPINVGFSADILFTHQGHTATKITKVLFCDCVHNPARGGAFVRALFQGDPSMTQAQTPSPVEPGAPVIPPISAPTVELEKELATLRTQMQVLTEKTIQDQQMAAFEQTRAQMNAYVLDAALQASRLPEQARTHVRAQFTNADKSVKPFQPSELEAAITAMRDLAASLQAPGLIQGASGTVRGMFSTEDQLQAAVDDLLNAPREAAVKTLKVHRLQGIRELYMLLTGDTELHGSMHPERIQLQHTTASFTGLVKNALNKSLVVQWDLLGRAGYDWWNKIVIPEHFDTLNSVTWTVFGSIGSLGTISEGAEYPELKIGDSPETGTFYKYGGYLGITAEAIDRDETRKLRDAPKELANAGIRNISSLVAALFTSASAVGPTLADTGALFNNTAVTTAGGHANLLTTALGTTYAAWEAVALAMYKQPMLISNDTGYIGTGQRQAVKPRICLVPSDLMGAAEALFIPRWSSVATTNAIATSGIVTYGGVIEPVTVPEWTDATDWAAVIDPNVVPGVGLGERFGIMPEIFIAGDERDPAVFMNDEFRIKVRHYIVVGIKNWRALHKSNVAG